MQAIPAAIAAAGITSTGIAVASAGVTAASAIMQGNYQAQVAQNSATIATRNAQRELAEGAVAAQEQDFAAQAEIGQLLSSQGASGLSMSVGSMGLRRTSKEQLAAKDRGYTIYNSRTRADQFTQQATDFREQARNIKTETMFKVTGAGFDAGTSLVSGASKVNNKKARGLAA